MTLTGTSLPCGTWPYICTLTVYSPRANAAAVGNLVILLRRVPLDTEVVAQEIEIVVALVPKADRGGIRR